MNRRLHLSKTKHSKFNESGQLAAFYLISFIWGCSILTAVKRPTKHCQGTLCDKTSTPSRCIFSLAHTFSSFHLLGGICNKSYFPMGGLSTHPHGVSKDLYIHFTPSGHSFIISTFQRDRVSTVFITTFCGVTKCSRTQ